jgi:hypothetical protein
MKIVVYAHSMEIGGSQLNAIEIGAAVQRLGHEVILVGERGPLAATAGRLGLEQFVIPERRQRPSPTVMRLLTGLVQRRGTDVCMARMAAGARGLVGAAPASRHAGEWAP